MENATPITLMADPRLIEAAVARARSRRTTLEAEFQRWLADYAESDERVSEAMDLIDRMSGYVSTGGHHFTRDEMNAR